MKAANPDVQSSTWCDSIGIACQQNPDTISKFNVPIKIQIEINLSQDNFIYNPN